MRGKGTGAAPRENSLPRPDLTHRDNFPQFPLENTYATTHIRRPSAPGRRAHADVEFFSIPL